MSEAFKAQDAKMEAMRAEFCVRTGDSMDTSADIALASRCDDIAQQLNELKEAQKAADTLI
eukprot:9072190-Pyramimonas_sp.AAC.1